MAASITYIHEERIVGILALGVPGEEKEPYAMDELKWEEVHR